MLTRERQLPTRVVKGMAVFARPFLLRTIGRELPAGSYAIENEEEAVNGAAYRRLEVRMIIPSVFGGAEAETWFITPEELDEALALDRQPASLLEQIARNAAAPVLQASRQDSLRGKGASISLYGSLLGVGALLLAAAYWFASS